MRQQHQAGLIHPLAVTTAVLAVFVIGLGGFSVWAYASYMDQKNNVDAKIAIAVTSAKKQQQGDDAKVFAEQEKQPTRQFVGPSDLGSVTFSYPKTWSVYINNDGSTGSAYEALLQPGAVLNPSNQKNAYALRVNVDTTKYEDALKTYQDKIGGGTLKASPVTINGQTGVRLDGQLSETIQGSIILFKVRDKTLRITTDSPTYVPDFNAIVVPSLKFNS